MNRKHKILIVEDEVINIEIYRELLEEEFELLVAEDGETAIQLMADEPPDLVLLDMMLPDINGVELCRRFKKNEASRHIPVIVVTTLTNKEDKIEGLKAGANDYLPKPIDKTELLLKVRNHLTTKKLTDRLNDSFQNIVTISSITAGIMSNFNPHYFDFSTNLFNLLNEYTSRIEKTEELPAFIMTSTSVNSTADSLNTVLYRVQDKILTPVSNSVHIDQFSHYAVSEGEMGQDVSFDNRKESSPDFQQFQERFHPDVQKHVGKIYNYISYHGKKVFIIAFNYGRPVNRFMAQVFKNFTLNGNFFKLIQDQLDGIKDAYNYALNSLARAAEANDELTGAHILRVNQYAGFIAQKLNLPDRLVTDITNSAQMHDIGKIHVHVDIIRKPGKLTAEEWNQMKRHPNFGAIILGNSEYMKVARNICLGHHENYDGSGYPRGLKGDKISIEARIVHLADVYDSLRSPRSYKPAFSHEKTMGIIVDGDGRTKPEHFDPECLAIFKNHHQTFADIYEQLADQ